MAWGGPVTGQAHRGRGPGRESRGVGPGRSPAGEEVKQRVLLLLSARRHGRAGSAARRRRCHWREAARRMREVVRSATPLLLGVGRRRPHARAFPRPAPSVRALRGVAAGPSPASAARAGLPVEPHRAAVTWRGPGRTSRGGALWGGERRGCGPGSARPLADERTWAGRPHSPGRGSARSARLDGASLGPSGWSENWPKQPCPR